LFNPLRASIVTDAERVSTQKAPVVPVRVAAGAAENPRRVLTGAGLLGRDQYSDASMMVKTLTVWRGSLGSSLPFVMVVS
jgi:hypothetical protein